MRFAYLAYSRDIWQAGKAAHIRQNAGQV